MYTSQRFYKFWRKRVKDTNPIPQWIFYALADMVLKRFQYYGRNYSEGYLLIND